MVKKKKEAQISQKGPTLCVMWDNRARLFMVGWLAAKSASADSRSRLQHSSAETTWQTDPAACSSTPERTIKKTIILRNIMIYVLVCNNVSFATAANYRQTMMFVYCLPYQLITYRNHQPGRP